MGHFTSPESQGDFNFISVIQKATHIAHFHVIVVIINIWPKLDFFDVDYFLLLLGLIFLLLGLEFILAVIENFAHWWISIG